MIFTYHNIPARCKLTMLAMAVLMVGCWRPAHSTPLVQFTPRFWTGGVVDAPRVAAVADADGDGRADILVFYPDGDAMVDYIHTSSLGKPSFPTQARKSFGSGGLAAVAAPFTGKRASVLAVF